MRLGIGAVGLGAFVILAFSVITAPGSKSPFAFLDRFYPPAVAQQKVDAEKRRVAEEKKAAEKAKAKAEAEAAAKAAEAEAAAKKAAEAKAAAKK